MNEQWQKTAGGLLIPAGGERTLQAVDLFCGAGGFSLGLEAAGVDVVGAMDNSPAAVQTYLWNLGSPRGCAVAYTSEGERQRFLQDLERSQRRHRKAHPLEAAPGDPGWIGYQRLALLGDSTAGHWDPWAEDFRYRQNGGWGPLGFDAGARGFVFGDARETTGELILEAMEAGGWRGEVDLVVGGPPCQGMTKCNMKRSPTDRRNDLGVHFVRLADELGARLWVMENVPPLVKEKRFRPVFMAIVEEARRRGFNVAANVVDCCDYGVPQRRRRAIVQGAREGMAIPRIPWPNHWSLTFPVNGEANTMLWSNPGSGRRDRAELEGEGGQTTLWDQGANGED